MKYLIILFAFLALSIFIEAKSRHKFFKTKKGDIIGETHNNE